MVGPVPPSCALLGGFAIGARVSMLWQHSGEREMSASACTHSMPALIGIAFLEWSPEPWHRVLQLEWSSEPTNQLEWREQQYWVCQLNTVARERRMLVEAVLNVGDVHALGTKVSLRETCSMNKWNLASSCSGWLPAWLRWSRPI